MPFLVPLLDDRGLDAAAIGLALGAAGVASLLAYPAWGAVADGRLGRRRTIALTSVTAATGGLLILLAGSDPLLITLAISVAILGALPWGPLIDALTLQELAEPSAAYGRVRAWASVGWAGSAIIGGAVWQIVGSGAGLRGLLSLCSAGGSAGADAGGAPQHAAPAPARPRRTAAPHPDPRRRARAPTPEAACHTDHPLAARPAGCGGLPDAASDSWPGSS